VAWLSGTDYTLAGIDGWALGEYRDWLREQDHANVTRKQYLSQLRVLLRWACRRNVMCDGLDDNVELTDLIRDDVRSDTSIGPDRVQRILDYMDRYQRASREHIIALLLAAVQDWRETRGTPWCRPLYGAFTER
jgi:integrase